MSLQTTTYSTLFDDPMAVSPIGSPRLCDNHTNIDIFSGNKANEISTGIRAKNTGNNADDICTGNITTNHANHIGMEVSVSSSNLCDNFPFPSSKVPSDILTSLNSTSHTNIVDYSQSFQQGSSLKSDVARASSLHFVNLSSAQKSQILQQFLEFNPTLHALKILSRNHIGLPPINDEPKEDLIARFRVHQCRNLCLFTVKDIIGCQIDPKTISFLGTSDATTARDLILQSEYSSSVSSSVSHQQYSPSRPSIRGVSPTPRQSNHLVYVKPQILNDYMHSLISKPIVHCCVLDSLLSLHGYPKSKFRSKAAKLKALRNHICSHTCLISYGDAINAHLPIEFYSNTESSRSARQSIITYYNGSDEMQQTINPKLPRSSINISDPQPRAKRARSTVTLLDKPEDQPPTKKACQPSIDTGVSLSWPILLSTTEKETIINNFRSNLSSETIKYTECSFCGIMEVNNRIQSIEVSNLNISLLDKAVQQLRLETRQQAIQPFNSDTIIDNCYQVCHICSQSIKFHKFVQIPLHSYSNNCWIGNIPEQLKDLSFLEQQCIARARATACTVKIEPGPTGQYRANGNVCILPQEPGSLIKTLPPPINEITDEIVVILVASEDTDITDTVLSKSPLLVRRQRILEALSWLRENNPLYTDINISYKNLLRFYPTDGVPKDLCIQHVDVNNMVNCESSSYMQFQTDSETQSHSINFSSTCITDPDQTSSTSKIRKIEAIKQIKEKNKPFVMFPSGSAPLSTWKNPAIYAYLWPTLFPYGVGLFEDSIREKKDFGFRPIHLKQHIKHLLSIKDLRFQTHLSFIFIMMNILQRRSSSYESKLACKRAWFSNVSKALEKISEDVLVCTEKKLKKSNYIQPENEGEKAILEVLNYVNYISHGITGSTAETHLMREEIRSVSREVGMPHLFLTINPADYYNPIYQIFAGRDINLDILFDNISPGVENLQRSKVIAQNPVAGAKGFNFVINAFINNLLGMNNPDRIGLFGEVRSYYGVVEAQHRGSLHCHFLIWLKYALPPNIVKQKLSDKTWRTKLVAWLEDIISQSFPPDSIPFNPKTHPYPITPVMTMPPDSLNVYDSTNWKQDLRNVLQVTGQVHEHQNTCFKHLPNIVKKHKDPDKDCRFQLPRPIVEETYFDGEGHLHLKCQHGSLNNYNPICVSCLRCNMDIKYVGSGTAALAMIEYVTNYIAKTSLDTSTVFSALCSAVTSLNSSSYPNSDPMDREARSRLLLLKVCNSMIGKRELTGQQTAAYLCGIPNRFTNHSFEKIYWSKVLQFTSRSIFKPINSNEPEPQTEQGGCSEAEKDYVLINKATLNQSLKNEGIQSFSLIDDIFHRPYELESFCLWEIEQKFYRTKLPKDLNSRASVELDNCFRFQQEHPLFNTHCLKHRSREVTPVLIGPSIPRCDDPESKEKYAAAMLTLFKPWSRNQLNILKNSCETWHEAFINFESTLKSSLKTIIENMQSIYKCRDAAHDYSKQRRERLTELNLGLTKPTDPADGSSWNEDPLWSFAMQQEADQLLLDDSFDDEVGIPLTLTGKEISTVSSFLQISQIDKFYVPDSNQRLKSSADFEVIEGDEKDESFAKQQHIELMREKQSYLSERDAKTATAQTMGNTTIRTDSQSSKSPPSAFSTTLSEHYEKIKKKLLRKSQNQLQELSPSQQFCCILVEKYNLNEEQTFAFLLYTNHIIQKSATPLRFIIAGPGGTGKSQIFEAIKEFHQNSQYYDTLKICAPTGLAANNIGGSTIHSEASLRTTELNETARTNLENRFRYTSTLICDEIYFLGARDNSILSKNLNIARDTPQTSTIYGGLSIIFAGDPAQLPPPGATSLYSQKALKLYENLDFNMLNTRDKEIAEGIFTWKQVDRCITLKRIMRQSESSFQTLLNRLRFGNCNNDDYSFLQKFVIQNRTAQTNKELLGIENWIIDRSTASPLICYTNVLRDIHNFKMCRAFAEQSKQPFTYYHSLDTMQGSKTVLKNTLAEIAWRTPIKPANDLAGRLPLIPGMPVFLTENLATELGLSNGSEGTLIKVKYYVWQSRRYPIYAEVDFKSYSNPNKPHPHRVIIQPTAQSIKIDFPHESKSYIIRRKQLPLLPGFAYTAHNSQGRSLDRACIDLASCPNTATAYVMLSRIRTLAGISILRPFSQAKICTHIPEEVQTEIKRLDAMHEKTVNEMKECLQWYYRVIQ